MAPTEAALPTPVPLQTPLAPARPRPSRPGRAGTPPAATPAPGCHLPVHRGAWSGSPGAPVAEAGVLGFGAGRRGWERVGLQGPVQRHPRERQLQHDLPRSVAVAVRRRPGPAFAGGGGDHPQGQRHQGRLVQPELDPVGRVQGAEVPGARRGQAGQQRGRLGGGGGHPGRGPPGDPAGAQRGAGPGRGEAAHGGHQVERDRRGVGERLPPLDQAHPRGRGRAPGQGLGRAGALAGGPPAVPGHHQAEVGPGPGGRRVGGPVGQLQGEVLGGAVAEPAGEPPLGHAGMPAPLDQRHVRRQGGQRPLGRHHPRRQVGHGDLARPPTPQPDEGRPEHDPAQERRRHRQHPPLTAAPIPEPAPAPTPEPRSGRVERFQYPGREVGYLPDRLEPEPAAQVDQAALEGRACRAAGEVRVQGLALSGDQLAVGGRRKIRHRLATAHRPDLPRPARPSGGPSPGRPGSSPCRRGPAGPRRPPGR